MPYKAAWYANSDVLGGLSIMITVLAFFCIHAVFMALFVAGLYTFDTEGLTQAQWIAASFGVLTVLSALYLLLHADKPKSLKGYLMFPCGWIIAFVLTLILCPLRNHFVTSLNAFLNFSTISMDILAMLSFVAFVSVFSFIKRYMGDPQAYDTKVSWLFRKLPLMLSTILYAILIQIIFDVKNVNILEINSHISLLLTFWINISAFVAIVIFVDKLPQSGVSLIAHMLFFVLCMTGAACLSFYSKQHIEIAVIMQNQGFLTMMTVFAEFICIGTLFAIVRSYINAPVRELGAVREV
jgi:hypothetical protein